jgi:hypothetical protein
MKVTETQIIQLKEFTKKHFVEWVDLQMELVDHLANGIESQWEKEPNLTFEQCLEREFGKFGVFGFMDVVDNRRNALEKKYTHLIFNHFIEFFSLPRIVATTTSVLVVFMIIKAKLFGPETKDVILVFFGIVFLSVILFNGLKLKQKVEGTKWLYKDIILGKSKLFSLGYLPIQVFSFTTNFENNYANFILAFLVVSSSIIVYVMNYEIPSKVEDYLNQNYPEYRFYKSI